MTIIIHIRMAVFCKLSIGCLDIVLRDIIIDLQHHMMMFQEFSKHFLYLDSSLYLDSRA
jgi:hypothetical protein